jgi:SprT protein
MTLSNVRNEQMKVSIALQDRIEKELARLVSVARFMYGRDFKMPKVLYNVKGTVAGYANVASNTVRFNPVLLNENVDAFIARTVPHEFAHIVDYVLNPGNFSRYRKKRSVHGPSWKSIMRDFGCDPSRCHSYDVSNAKQKRTAEYVWTCSHCGNKMTLGPKRHHKMASGSAMYWPISCRSHLHTAEFTHGQYRRSRTVVKQVQPNVVNMPVQAPKTKFEICSSIFNGQRWNSRKECIELFVREAGCTAAGAATYYHQLNQQLKMKMKAAAQTRYQDKL